MLVLSANVMSKCSGSGHHTFASNKLCSPNLVRLGCLRIVQHAIRSLQSASLVPAAATCALLAAKDLCFQCPYIWS